MPTGIRPILRQSTATDFSAWLKAFVSDVHLVVVISFPVVLLEMKLPQQLAALSTDGLESRQ